MDLGLDFGRYRPLFKLASGGMAEVYAGLQTGEAGFTKVVAIKRMHAHLGQDEHFVTMFLDEARLAAAIRSPHVVSTVDVGRSGDGTPYLVMDLVIGVNLAELIVGALRAGQPMPRAELLLAENGPGLLRDEILRRLFAGEPAISLAPSGKYGIFINPQTLRPGEIYQVIDRLLSVFHAVSSEEAYV